MTPYELALNELARAERDHARRKSSASLASVMQARKLADELLGSGHVAVVPRKPTIGNRP